MAEKYKKLRDLETFESNPFVEKAIEDIKIVRKTQIVKARDKREIQMIVSDGGEVTGYSQFLRFIEVDEAQFAKVYLSQFSAFWDLSKPAIKVFSYILTVLKPNQDQFNFDIKKCLKHTGYLTDKSIFEGLSSLISNGIIARSHQHYLYFINPLVLFNGDRVTFAKTYIKKKTRENPMQLNLLDEIENMKALKQ